MQRLLLAVLGYGIYRYLSKQKRALSPAPPHDEPSKYGAPMYDFVERGRDPRQR